MLKPRLLRSRRNGTDFPVLHVFLLLWTLRLLCFAAAGFGQSSIAEQKPAVAPPTAGSFNATAIGIGSRKIDGLWKIQIGDDMQWAQPGFDDSKWETRHVERYISGAKHPSPSGFYWYRRQITLDPTDKNSLSLYLPEVRDTAEVYWNGVKVGGYGKMPPHPLFFMAPRPTAIALPSTPGISSATLAIRVWAVDQDGSGFPASAGFRAYPELGYPTVIEQAQQSWEFKDLQEEAVTGAASIISAMVGLAALILWLRSRSQWLLLCVAVYCSLYALEDFAVLCPAFSYWTAYVALLISNGGRDIFFLFIILLLTEFPNRPGIRGFRFWNRVCIATTSIVSLGAIAEGMTLLPFVQHGSALMRFLKWCSLVNNLKVIYLPIILAGCLIFGKRRLPRLLFIAAATLDVFLDDGINWVSQFHGLFDWITKYTDKPLVNIYGSPLNIFTASELLLLMAIIYAVWDQISRELAEQRRVNAELKAAQEVQTVLVAAEERGAPGYSISSIYRPASEVGGDFFQIIPLEDDVTLIVTGDVSGKGLRAAMTVSMLVGAMRTLAEQDSNPAAVLHGLNRRLIGRIQGGFATCCAVRIDPTGQATMANAGHCQPYIDGREVELPAGLPLGLVEEVTYDEIAVTVAHGQQLTLISDGVVEARNPRGELYGFERLSQLLRGRPTAEQVANTAVDFGQDDDITVLTLTRFAGEPTKTMELSDLSSGSPSPAPA